MNIPGGGPEKGSEADQWIEMLHMKKRRVNCFYLVLRKECIRNTLPLCCNKMAAKKTEFLFTRSHMEEMKVNSNKLILRRLQLNTREKKRDFCLFGVFCMLGCLFGSVPFCFVLF